MSGRGSYVSVDEHNVGLNRDVSEDLVVSRFDSTLALAESMQVKVDAYLVTMNNLLEEFELPDGWADALDDVELTPIPEFDFGAAPTFSDLELPEWSVSFPILGALKPAPEVDLSVTEPGVPDEITPSISHEDAAYSSELWLATYTKVLYNVENGGTGLEASVEQAIYDRAKERQRKENEAQYDKLMASVGSAGYNMPGGAVVSVQQTMAEELLRQAVDINEKIFIAQGDLAQKNTHFMIERATVMEQILREFHNNRENRSFEAEKASAELIVQVYEANVKAYMAKWDGQKLKLESAITQIDAVMKENDYILQEFKARMAGEIAYIDGVSKQTNALVEGYKGQVAGYTAEVEATSAWYKALSEEQRNQLGVAELELRKATAEIESEIKGFVSYNDLKRQLVTDMTNIANQSVASSLNAVNASASYGFSSGASLSEGWSHSDSIGESHSFEEEGA